MSPLERIQTRIAGLERVQAACWSRERADRLAHMRTALRRYRETSLRISYAAVTRNPFGSP